MLAQWREKRVGHLAVRRAHTRPSFDIAGKRLKTVTTTARTLDASDRVAHAGAGLRGARARTIGVQDTLQLARISPGDIAACVHSARDRVRSVSGRRIREASTALSEHHCRTQKRHPKHD